MHLSCDTSTATIGDFLLRRLRELGIRHMFGVPGDYNLQFLEQLVAANEIAWVGCCNELNAAYAADGYGRSAGIAALLTTYGVGELSALGGVAGAYAEHVPVVVLTGAPPLSDIERHALVHHSTGAGNFDEMLAAARPFSAAQTRITPQNAVAEIDRCLRACVVEKRPVYLQLPSDITFVSVRVPNGPLDVSFASDAAMLAACAEAVASTVRAAGSVAILVDADVERRGAADAIVRLAEAIGAPIATMGTGKSAIDESHPQFVGTYGGAFSAPGVREIVEDADCLILAGVRFLDSTTGAFSHRIDPERCVALREWNATVAGKTYHGVALAHALDRLADVLANGPKRSLPVAPVQPDGSVSATPDRPTHAWFWKRVASFLRSGDTIVAENGTPLTGINGIRLPSHAKLIGQSLWGAIGYALPALLGSMLGAPERRHVLFIGDGSFQVTAQELSTILRLGLTPLVVLIDNDGYTIERLILGKHAAYNDVQRWNYVDLPRAFHSSGTFESRRLETTADVEAALAGASDATVFRFFDVVFDRLDAPAGLLRVAPSLARADYGTSWAAAGSPGFDASAPSANERAASSPSEL